MGIDWNDTTDENSYVVVQKEKKNRITELAVLSENAKDSIFTLLFADTQGEEREQHGE